MGQDSNHLSDHAVPCYLTVIFQATPLMEGLGVACKTNLYIWISVKCTTSRGKAHNQEAAVQQTFPLETNSFFYPALLPSGSEATPHENRL